MDAVPVLCPPDNAVGRRPVGAILRAPFGTVVIAPPLPLVGVLVIVADLRQVVRRMVHELRDSTGDVLVEVRLQLSLEVEALVLSGLVLLVVVDPLQLSRGSLVELRCGARCLELMNE